MEDLQSTTEFMCHTLKPQDQPIIEEEEIDLQVLDSEREQVAVVVAPKEPQSFRSAQQLSEDSHRWTRQDFLNFSIEEIWKEMEVINLTRKAAQYEFQQFQDNFFDRSANGSPRSINDNNLNSPDQQSRMDSMSSATKSICSIISTQKSMKIDDTNRSKCSVKSMKSIQSVSTRLAKKQPFGVKNESYNNIKVSQFSSNKVDKNTKSMKVIKILAKV